MNVSNIFVLKNAVKDDLQKITFPSLAISSDNEWGFPALAWRFGIN